MSLGNKVNVFLVKGRRHTVPVSEQSLKQLSAKHFDFDMFDQSHKCKSQFLFGPGGIWGYLFAAADHGSGEQQLGGKKQLIHLDNLGVVGINGKGQHCHQLTFVWLETKEQLGAFALASAYPSPCKFRCLKGVHGSAVVANPTPTPHHDRPLSHREPDLSQGFPGSGRELLPLAAPPRPRCVLPLPVRS